MSIYLMLVVAVLMVLLVQAYRKNTHILNQMRQFIEIRDTALDIANRVVNTHNSAELYHCILESCLKVIPKAKFGSILMFNEEGLLVAKASVGFNKDEMSRFKLKLEETFIYLATDGKLDKTVITNRLDDLIQEEKIVTSDDLGFALKSEVSAPLYIDNELVGLLCINGDESDIFSEKDIFVLDYMSKQISIVMNNQKLYGEILHLSKYDCLTNLLNRNSFDSETTRLLNSPETDLCNTYFVLMDLDGLKEANDTFGHNFGDELIISFAAIIKNHLGNSDLCGRYGGDEFVAIFQGDYSLLEKNLEKMNRNFMYSQNIYKEGVYIPRFSYGIARFNEGHCCLDALYKLADTRMYEIKKNKKQESYLEGAGL